MNFKFIADNDPGGELDAAYRSMSTETISGTGKVLLTDQSIANDLGLVVGITITEGIEQAVADGELPARIIRWLEGDGIDVNHVDTQATLVSLHIGGYISEAHKNALIALGDDLAYPGLTKSQLDKARRLRSEGKV